MKREIMVYVPNQRQFLYASEGTGDNLLPEDVDAGYVDYVYVETYIYKDRRLVEYDGAQKMLTKSFEDEYKNDVNGERLVKDVMDIVWGTTELEYVVIENLW